MESISLYDALVGCFLSRGDEPDEVDEHYFDAMTEDEKIRQSIVENLKMVLQTRRGSVQHLPDFGIPDIRQIYLEGGTTEDIKQQILETILKYEPRIGEVRVRKKPEFDRANMRITLEIAAKIKDTPGREVLLTEFSSTGWTRVVFEKDAEKNL